MELQIEHLVVAIVAMTPTIGLIYKFMTDKAEVAKWRGVGETKLKQAEEDRKIIHERIDDRDNKLDEMSNCLKTLSTKVDILIDRQERKE